MMKFIKILPILILFILPVTCVDDADNVDPATITSTYTGTPDGTTGLTINNVYPQSPPLVSVNIDSILVIFSKAVNPATITVNTNVVFSGGVLGAPVSLGDDTTFSFPFGGGPLANTTTYTVTFGAGIVASDGTALTISGPYSFDTE